MDFIKILFLVLCFEICFSNANKVESCPHPYSQCNLGKNGMINVHIVPHTHDDVG
jgi:hypothetical protein